MFVFLHLGSGSSAWVLSLLDSLGFSIVLPFGAVWDLWSEKVCRQNIMATLKHVFSLSLLLNQLLFS